MNRKGTRLGRLELLGCLVALIAAAASALSARPADAALYWSSGNALGRANLDGGSPLWPLPNGWFPALDAGSVCGLAADGQHLYWADPWGGTIGRSTLDGTSPEDPLVGGLTDPCGIAVDASHIYWTELEANLIGRADLDGGNVEPGFIVGVVNPCGVAVDAGHVYWANQEGGSIGRARIDGGEVEREFIAGLRSPCGVAVTDKSIFWGDQSWASIGRARLDGTEVEPTLIPNAGEPWDVDVIGSSLYWADRDGSSYNDGGIGRALLDRGEVNRNLIPSVNFPTGVAVDTRTISVPAAQPDRMSDYLRFGKLTHNRRTGEVQLIVDVPERGELNIDSPQISWRINKGDPPSRIAGALRWKLRLWPGRAPIGKKIRRRLRRGGKASVELALTYKQEGRLPLEATKRVWFVKRARRGRKSGSVSAAVSVSGSASTRSR